jgi:squalene-hopene/tetraprenyl-beta-curcumene cyclase
MKAKSCLLIVLVCWFLAASLRGQNVPLQEPAATVNPGYDLPSPAEDASGPRKPLSLTPNRADEPFRKDFSVSAAIGFLDVAALAWHNERKCFACHSDYMYLMVRPVVSSRTPVHQELRAALEQVAEHPRTKPGKIGVTEAVMAATVLASNDASTSDKLHPTTRKALDRMWTLQREDGGFDWLKSDQPPSEIDDHYGVTMAAIGAGVAPEHYADTPQARAGLDKIRKYLVAHPPENLHHRAMGLLASRYIDGIMTEPQSREVVEQLFAIQKPDGGWAVATFGKWERCDGGEQDTASSDGYGTGFAVYVLRRAGVPADEPRVQRGIVWLKTHQRTSGRWFTRSLWKDQKHYLTHDGTAYAILALAECGEMRSEAELPSSLPEPRTIVVFGDSITAGGALPKEDRDKLWLRVIENSAHGTVKLVNEGKGGRPTASRPEFDAMLTRQPRVDAVVIALGMNDSRDISEACVPKAAANLRYMIERARQKFGAALPILLVGPSNINKSALGPTKPIANEREAKLRELGEGFASLAKETDCDFVSLFGVVPEASLLKDGVHPDAAGNAAIAETVRKKLVP